MPERYFAIGTTLANMVNVETLTGEGEAPHALPDAWIPLLSEDKERAMDNSVVRDSAINTVARWNSLPISALHNFIYTVFGGFEVGSVERYVTWLDESRYYSPFLCTIDKPQARENYILSDSGLYALDLEILLFDCELQSTTYATNHSITASERFTLWDTSGGNRTATLPAANAVQANTIVSVQKVAAANTLTIQRAGSDTVEGGTSIALTALYGRYDLASDGVSAWRIVTVY